MSRHAVSSSPWRSPAVLVGVPVAAVLATAGSNLLLGGVVPSAEETPLRAAAPAEVSAGALDPAAGPPAPVPAAPTVVDAAGAGVDLPARAPVVLESALESQESAAGPHVVRVADEAARTTGAPAVGVRPSATTPRVVDVGRERAATATDATATTATTTATGTAVTSAAARSSSVAPDTERSQPVVPRRTVDTSTPATPSEGESIARTASVPVSSREDDGAADDDGPVVGLGGGRDGLSVLSFG